MMRIRERLMPMGLELHEAIDRILAGIALPGDEDRVIHRIAAMIRREYRRGRQREDVPGGGHPPGGLRTLFSSSPEFDYTDAQIDADIWADEERTPGAWPLKILKLALLIYGHMLHETCTCTEERRDRRPDFLRKEEARCREQHTLKNIKNYAGQTLRHWHRMLEQVDQAIAEGKLDPVVLAKRRDKITIRIDELESRAREDWYLIFLWRAVLGSPYPFRMVRGLIGSMLFPLITSPGKRHLGWTWEDGKAVIFEKEKFISLKGDHDHRSRERRVPVLVCWDCGIFIGSDARHEACRRESHLWELHYVDLRGRDYEFVALDINTCRQRHCWHRRGAPHCPEDKLIRRKGKSFSRISVYVPSSPVAEILVDRAPQRWKERM